MPQIHLLSDLLVNKIAAGEVIERPASVVKECVENSLDAQARRIEIAIEQGGRKLIRVVDDGGGMDGQDLAMCILPHATSKIHNEQDLFGIRTMGFRGEALPSIGAVSQLRVLSRQAGADEAYEVCVAGNRIEPVTAAAGPSGTTVEVRELFFNVPARQKFLRTPQTEMGHITEQLARIALAHPQVEFRLTHNGRLVHHLRPGGDIRSRIADFYGRDLADNLLEILRDERGLAIHGYVARPAESRSSAKWQYIFLNGRYIRDRFISHAVREAYRGLIDPHRCPVIFLALTIDPNCVDINVHPTKIEVRWRDSNMLYTQVLSVLRDRFLNADLTPDLQTIPADREITSADGRDPLSAPTQISADDQAETRRQQIRQSIADFFKRSTPIVDRPPAPFKSQSASPIRPSTSGPPLAAPKGDGLLEPRESPQQIREFMPAWTEDDRACGSDEYAYDNAIQINRTYLVAETADGLVIIDQHALHERVLFEQMSEQIARGPLESQRLLIPDTVDVPPDQVEVIEIHAQTLNRLGFELTGYGPNSIAVHAAPSLLKPERMLEFLRDMLDRLAGQAGPASAEQLINDLLSMMACKTAVRAGDPLSSEEIRALMRQRGHVERSSNCPHGRPTSLRLTLNDLERQFKRT